jgi:hypothetical protein
LTIYYRHGLEFASMQFAPVPGVVAQAVPPTAAAAVVAPVGPAAPAAPIEPGKRVTANRDTGRGDLQGQQQAQRSPQAQTRGRLLDLWV